MKEGASLKGWIMVSLQCPECFSRLLLNTGKYDKYLCKKCNEYFDKDLLEGKNVGFRD